MEHLLSVQTVNSLPATNMWTQCGTF